MKNNIDIVQSHHPYGKRMTDIEKLVTGLKERTKRPKRTDGWR